MTAIKEAAVSLEGQEEGGGGGAPNWSEVGGLVGRKKKLKPRMNGLESLRVVWQRKGGRKSKFDLRLRAGSSLDDNGGDAVWIWESSGPCLNLIPETEKSV